MVATSARSAAPAPDAVRGMLAPGAELEASIREFLNDQLGDVLPADPRRGLDDYYDKVVLGARAVDAYTVIARAAPANGPIVDVGCGLGSFVLLARQLGMDAIGFEPGEREVELARARADGRGVPGEVFERASGERLPLADGAAAGVLLQDVLEHTPAWRVVLREAVRLIAPGGVVYVKSPSYSGIRFREPHYRTLWAPMLPRPFARAYLRARGRDVGYFDDHIVYLRRGRVLAELRRLGLELSFPRLHKLEHPEEVNRRGARRLAKAAAQAPRPLKRLTAENSLQSVVDVLARKPA